MSAVRRLLGICWIALAMFGCSSADDSDAPVPVARSSWGDITTLESAEQGGAPAIWATVEMVAAAWIDSVENQSFQYMRALTHSDTSEATQLTLPPTFPHRQSLLPAARRHFHLLWLDASDDDVDDGLRLWSAVITPDLLVERGRVLVSDRKTFNYAAAPASNQQIWAAWSGGLPAEPTLFLQLIDAAGRPRPAQEIATDADFPVIIGWDAGQTDLYWLAGRQDAVYHAPVGLEGVVGIPQRIIESVELRTGDRLVSVTGGLDNNYRYLFWHVVRSAGEPETWFASSPRLQSSWSDPVRLGASIARSAIYETGFNGGSGQPAILGKNWVRWSSPMPGQFDRLALAAEMDGALGVLFFEDGVVTGYRHTVSLEGPLLGPPALRADRERHLYMAWAAPDNRGASQLNITATRG